MNICSKWIKFTCVLDIVQLSINQSIKIDVAPLQDPYSLSLLTNVLSKLCMCARAHMSSDECTQENLT